MINNPKNPNLKELNIKEKIKLFDSFYKTAYLIIGQQELAVKVTKEVFRQESKRKKQDKRKYDKPDNPKNPALTITDIIDAQRFGQRLVKDNDLFTKTISKKLLKNYLANNFQEVLSNSYKSEEVLKNLKELLKKGLNKCISQEDLLTDLRAVLSPKLESMLDSIVQLNKMYTEVRFIIELKKKQEKAHRSNEAINRLILERYYQGQIVTSTQRQAVNHTLEQSLQISTLIFSDQTIKSHEEDGKVTELDMIISFIVNLLIEVYSNNPFYAAVVFAGLIFEYDRKDIQEIYSLVVQNRDTEKDPEQFSGLKRRLMNLLMNEEKIEEGRFGKYHILSKEVTPNSLRFKTRSNCQEIASEIRLILERLTFRSDPSCINFKEDVKKDQEKWIITPLVFQGTDPDQEHPFFQRQIHLMSHPPDFEEIINMLNLPNPFLCLAIPEITPVTQTYKDSNSDNNNTYFNSPLDKQNDRFNPPPLDEEKVKDFFEKTLENEENLAKKILSQKVPRVILVKINNKTCARFRSDNPPKDNILLVDTPSLLSVFWEYPESSFGDVVVQSFFIRAEFDETTEETITCDLGKGRRLVFTIEHDPGRKQFHIHIDYELVSVFSWLNKWLQIRSGEGQKNSTFVLAGALVAVLVIAVGLQIFTNNQYGIIENNPTSTPTPTPTNRSPNKNQEIVLYVTLIGDDPLKIESLLKKELRLQKVRITDKKELSNHRLTTFINNDEAIVSVESVGDPLGEELKWEKKYNINKNNQTIEIHNVATDIIEAINDYKLKKNR